MILKLKYGEVELELFEDVAPNHVKRFKELSNNGKEILREEEQKFSSTSDI